MKRFIKKWLKMIVVVAFVFVVFSVSSYARITRSYYFSFPESVSNSMRYTYKYEVDGGTPYVYPSISTISTQYFLSPNTYGWTQATDVATINDREWRNFTWNSGYGGSGQYYCLAGCPATSSYPWDAYNAYGVFGE
jgi:hypothetical protein